MAQFYRHVDGDLTRSLVRTSPRVRHESLSRDTGEVVGWRFKQPDLALFWWHKGVRRFSIDVAGERRHVESVDEGSLAVIPPDSHAQGEFRTDHYCEYDVLFFDHDLIKDCNVDFSLRPLLGFADQAIQLGLRELARWKHDATFPLLAEGWALQTLGRLEERMGRANSEEQTASLGAQLLRTLRTYVQDHLASNIAITDLADLSGMSARHFARSFKQSTGETPARFVRNSRIIEAKRLLAQGDLPIAQIGEACGFSHPQHFANSFHRAAGCSPSAFRMHSRT